MKTQSLIPRILFLTIALTIVSACSPTIYQQITTLGSEQVTLKDNGDYVAETPLFTIEYDFWSTNGNVCFTITNNSNAPLYLNLAESFFVNNGYAYDYYKARTYVYSHKSTVGYGTTGSASVAGSVGASVTGKGILYPIASESASLSRTYGVSSSVSVASQNGYSVEYAEKDIVCIPAHSSKSFEEFIVSSDLYRECGFARNPSKKETMVKNYNLDNSPRIIENRLTLVLDKEIIPVNHVFYVSQIQNIAIEHATKNVERRDCSGARLADLRINVLGGANKYYINYIDAYNTDRNDRPISTSSDSQRSRQTVERAR